MDEEVGKGGCHRGQGSYMDPFAQARAVKDLRAQIAFPTF